jgi:hypothetical protein
VSPPADGSSWLIWTSDLVAAQARRVKEAWWTVAKIDDRRIPPHL